MEAANGPVDYEPSQMELEILPEVGRLDSRELPGNLVDPSNDPSTGKLEQLARRTLAI